MSGGGDIMMKLPVYQVDAFARRVFEGNPAAVVPLRQWIDDNLMQSIAMENNLSETVFFLVDKVDGRRPIRWFTPVYEVDLCGHATLAAAWVAIHKLGIVEDPMEFQSASGPLSVRRDGDKLVLDFPAIPLEPADSHVFSELEQALGVGPLEVYKAMDLMAVFEMESQIRTMRPDMKALSGIPARGLIVTAPGEKVDFVSRFFAPGAGVEEDPVTGSAHCQMAPYWAERFGRNHLVARQISSRGGDLECRIVGDRVHIAGHAVLFSEGYIALDNTNG